METLKPKLTITGGIARKQATDEYGNAFVEIIPDFSSEPGECAACGRETDGDSGWLCLDGGEEYHDECVEITRG